MECKNLPKKSKVEPYKIVFLIVLAVLSAAVAAVPIIRQIIAHLAR